MNLEHTSVRFTGTKFSVVEGSQTLPNGKQVRREAVIHGGSVVVLPLVAGDRVVMIRNQRFVVQETLWELPAGTMERGEDPLDTAKRELIEETGYQSQTIEPLTNFYISPGYCTERMHGFVAHDLQLVGQQLEETEQINVELLNWAAIHEMIRAGTIQDAKTLLALLFFERYFR